MTSLDEQQERRLLTTMPGRDKILIVEENPDKDSNLQERLQQDGYFLTYALDAEEALAHISRELPTCILLDANLPGGSALQLLRHLRDDDRTHTLPILMMGEARTSAPVILAFAEGASDFVERPINLELLLVRIHAHIQLYEHTRQLAEKLKTMESNTLTDPLTGILNRRGFLETLESEILRASRFHQPLTLLLLDVDHFRKVNDSHGHPMGDRILKHMVEVLGYILRGSDILARYGGEEFAAILPGTGMEQGHKAAERIRVAVENTPHLEPGTVIRHTISIGASSYDGGPSLPTVLDLVEGADKALHLAKTGGRNQVRAYDLRGTL